MALQVLEQQHLARRALDVVDDGPGMYYRQCTWNPCDSDQTKEQFDDMYNNQGLVIHNADGTTCRKNPPKAQYSNDKFDSLISAMTSRHGRFIRHCFTTGTCDCVAVMCSEVVVSSAICKHRLQSARTSHFGSL